VVKLPNNIVLLYIRIKQMFASDTFFLNAMIILKGENSPNIDKFIFSGTFRQESVNIDSGRSNLFIFGLPTARFDWGQRLGPRKDRRGELTPGRGQRVRSTSEQGFMPLMCHIYVAHSLHIYINFMLYATYMLLPHMSLVCNMLVACMFLIVTVLHICRKYVTCTLNYTTCVWYSVYFQ